METETTLSLAARVGRGRIPTPRSPARSCRGITESPDQGARSIVSRSFRASGGERIYASGADSRAAPPVTGALASLRTATCR